MVNSKSIAVVYLLVKLLNVVVSAVAVLEAEINPQNADAPIFVTVVV